ncbi:LPXTG cell wall anchor domain-containing protein [Phytoactinopolyspora endophytica]
MPDTGGAGVAMIAVAGAVLLIGGALLLPMTRRTRPTTAA